MELKMNGLILCLVLSGCYGQTVAKGEILKSAVSMEEWIIHIRRKLHQIPELQFDLPKTTGFVKEVLDSLNISYKYPVGKSGIVAEIGSGLPVIGLRADMDALPIQEPEGLDFKSLHEGKMHACGHDAHTSMLLGAARLLRHYKNSFKGTVRLVFQPAEEIGSGAEQMISEGVLDNMDMMFGFHVWPTIESGFIATKNGIIMASINRFEVKVNGKGGHASMPHLLIDPYIPVANMILAYQTIISRRMSAKEAHVISVTKIDGGQAFNVIPDSVTFHGTMRSLEIDGIHKLMAEFENITKNIAETFGCHAEVKYGVLAGPVINNEESTSFAKETAQKLFGNDQVIEADSSTGAEDFSFYALKIPATFIFLGIQNESIGATASLHSPYFRVDETILHKGAAYHAALALDYLQQSQSKDSHQIKTEL